MGNKKLVLFFFIAPLLIIFCTSVPEPQPEPQPEYEPVPQITEVPEEPHTAVVVTYEYYQSTRTGVQQFIEHVNQIIRTRNFQAWRDALWPAHYEELSSPENLRQVSEQPAMRMRNIVLRTANDYFIHVVVPSRAEILEIPIDDIDIEFLSLNRVKAFAMTTSRTGESREVRLYDLEKTDGSWFIIN